ncbi:hypothetical protein MKX03_020848, partial [Papaver bracteatum]
GIGRLTSPQNLETYSVEHNNGIGDLGQLNLLKGKLLNLQNMRGGAEEARPENLKLKENIT